MTNGTGLPLKAVFLSISAMIIESRMPNTYRAIITSALCFGKKAAANTAYMGIFAEQLM